MERGTLVAAPDRSRAQRDEALEKANWVRAYRKSLKAEMKLGVRSARDVLLEPVEEELTMKVMTLLLAIPKVGRVKAQKRLGQLRISPVKTVGGMSERQRRELAALLARW